VHAAALLGDRFLHPSLADIAVPFVSSYKSGWMTLGIVSGWATIVLGLSYYARRAIGAVRWRKLHRLTALAWLGGLVHSLGMGTDAGQLWFLAMAAIVAVPALALLGIRASATHSLARFRRAKSRRQSGSLLEPGRVAGDEPRGAGHRLRPASPA
jgi:sulfoxide reductase heme-binding subunit YedZ